MSESISTPLPNERSIPDRISKNSFWVLIGQGGSAFFSFIAVFLMTRYLGPEKYGFYSTALSLALILLPLSDLGFDLFMIRAISTDRSRLPHELSHTMSIKCILAVIVLGLMILIGTLLRYDSFIIGYIALIGVSFLISALAQSLISAIRAIRKMRYESLSLLMGRASTTLTIFILVLFKADLAVLILAYLLGSIVIFAAAYYFLNRQYGYPRISFSLSGWFRRLKGAFPFGVTAILSAVYFKIDIIILSKMQDATSVGLYNSAQNLIGGSVLLASPLVVAMFPAMAALYQTRKEEADDIFGRGLTFILLLGLPLGVGTAFMAGSVIKLIYGAKFLPAIPLLTIMAAKIPIVYLTLLIGTSLGAVGYQKNVAIVAAVNVIFNVVMNFLLIPVYGAKAAAMVTVGTELLGLIQYAFITRGKLNLGIYSEFMKIIICCVMGIVGFVVVNRLLGPWPAAAAFVLLYALLALQFKLISISMVKDMLVSRQSAMERSAA
jgi:O-antigen/teichoic acid export membrane protein